MDYAKILEYLGLAVPVVVAIYSGIKWAYKKIIKPVLKMIQGHDYIMVTVEQIKNELTTNGGSSIKDTINRIDRRQIMIDKRSKAVFYNLEEAILEVDQNGNILWANESFHKFFKHKNLNGLDWVCIIDEPKREEFIKEFKSCSKQNRELNFETVSTDGKVVIFSGFPYRDDNKTYGFLIYLKGE